MSKTTEVILGLICVAMLSLALVFALTGPIVPLNDPPANSIVTRPANSVVTQSGTVLTYEEIEIDGLPCLVVREHDVSIGVTCDWSARKGR